MLTTMVLIRHGDPGYRDTFVGTTDYPLLEKATDDVRELSDRLKGEGIEFIYSSRMKRSVQTADLIAGNLGMKVSGRFEELNEIDFGRWEDLSFEEVMSRYPGDLERRIRDLWNFSGNGGESYSQVRDRVMPVISKLLERHEGKTFAVVSHGVVMRIVLSVLTGAPVEELRKRKVDFLASMFFKKDGDKIEVEKTWGVGNGL